MENLIVELLKSAAVHCATQYGEPLGGLNGDEEAADIEAFARAKPETAMQIVIDYLENTI